MERVDTQPTQVKGLEAPNCLAIPYKHAHFAYRLGFLIPGSSHNGQHLIITPPQDRSLPVHGESPTPQPTEHSSPPQPNSSPNLSPAVHSTKFAGQKRISLLLVPNTPSSQGYGVASPGLNEQAFFDDIIKQPLVKSTDPRQQQQNKIKRRTTRKTWESVSSSSSSAESRKFVSEWISLLEPTLGVTCAVRLIRARVGVGT